MALIPEADYTADIYVTSDGTADNTSVRFHGLSLDETVQVATDGMVDGTTVHIQGLALNETLNKADMENATLLKDLVMKELNQSDIAIGMRTTKETSDVEVIVPTRDDMPMGNYIVLSAAIDRETGKIAAINQTVMSMGYTITYDLVEGWNLIAVPLDLSDSSIDGFFPASIESEIWDLWGWDSSQQTWTYFSPDPNSPFQQYTPITTIEAGKGYWVNMNSSASFTINGVVPVGAPNATIPLVSNWNLVGVTGKKPMSPDTMYPTAWDVWRWDASRQDWDYFSIDPNTPFKNYVLITTIQPGQGIWVNM